MPAASCHFLFPFSERTWKGLHWKARLFRPTKVISWLTKNRHLPSGSAKNNSNSMSLLSWLGIAGRFFWGNPWYWFLETHRNVARCFGFFLVPAFWLLGNWWPCCHVNNTPFPSKPRCGALQERAQFVEPNGARGGECLYHTNLLAQLAGEVCSRGGVTAVHPEWM